MPVFGVWTKWRLREGDHKAENEDMNQSLKEKIKSLLRHLLDLHLIRTLVDRLRGRIVIGSKCRISRLSRIRTVNGGTVTIGNNCNIHDYAMIMTYGGNITMGDNCSVNHFSVIYGHGGLEIGNGVRIATHVVIIPATHNYEDTKRFIYQQGERYIGIKIEDDVWIGAGAKILDGVTVGRGAVIGSGSVVTRDVPPYTVVAGVPAKLIKSRRDSEENRKDRA
jgi:acetyltransferase-like isoleucine patch superfamily enzyme